MSFAFYSFFLIIALLFVALVWSLRGAQKRTASSPLPALPQDLQGSHIAHLPQILRALASTDYEFASERIPQEALRRMRRDRQRVALAYLYALREEFDELLRTARGIAALSPQVAADQELERAVLTLNFLWRYRIIRIGLQMGFAPLPQIRNLSNLLSGLSVRLEAAMKELGERAAQMAEMVSSHDRRRIHPV